MKDYGMYLIDNPGAFNCPVCGKVIESDDLIMGDICQHCNKTYFICSHCDNPIIVDVPIRKPTKKEALSFHHQIDGVALLLKGHVLTPVLN